MAKKSQFYEVDWEPDVSLKTVKKYDRELKDLQAKVESYNGRLVEAEAERERLQAAYEVACADALEGDTKPRDEVKAELDEATATVAGLRFRIAEAQDAIVKTRAERETAAQKAWQSTCNRGDKRLSELETMAFNGLERLAVAAAQVEDCRRKVEEVGRVLWRDAERLPNYGTPNLWLGTVGGPVTWLRQHLFGVHGSSIRASSSMLKLIRSEMPRLVECVQNLGQWKRLAFSVDPEQVEEPEAPEEPKAENVEQEPEQLSPQAEAIRARLKAKQAEKLAEYQAKVAAGEVA